MSSTTRLTAVRRRSAVIALVLTSVILGTPGGSSFAHTDTDLVAVPAGSHATVALRPTHGCGDSATVTVRIRAPFEDAQPERVDGWQETATSDGAGNTVLEWTGGVLPADETGAFPVSFTAPDEPGRLLVFPAVQRCEDGEELAWINGDPTAEYPAPRVLVLPAGAAPAATIDDVPPDSPGRDQLVAIVDVDGATAAPATSTTITDAPTATAPATTSDLTTTIGGPGATTATAPSSVTANEVATTISDVPVGDDEAGDEAGGDDSGDDDGGGSLAVALGGAVAAAAVAAIVIARRRRA